MGKQHSMQKEAHLENTKLQYYSTSILYSTLWSSTHDVVDMDDIEEYRRRRANNVVKMWNAIRSQCTEAEQNCFYLYYYENIRQDKIAKLMGFSQEFVVKCLKKLIKKIRIYIIENEKQLALFDASPFHKTKPKRNKLYVVPKSKTVKREIEQDEFGIKFAITIKPK